MVILTRQSRSFYHVNLHSWNTGSGRVAASNQITIEFITISSTGNATDYGELTTATSGNTVEQR